MDFNKALEIVNEVIPESTSQKYDGILVKKLEASNTLDEGRTTNQTHIAITGKQMDIFPYLAADGYFETDYNNRDEDLKKYFIAQIPLRLYKSNVERLGEDLGDLVFDNTGVLMTGSCIVRSRRKDAADQVQLSLTTNDDSSFISFRKKVHAGTYLVLLKHEEKFLYDCFAVKATEAGALAELNNGFYKKATKTTINVSKLLNNEAESKDSEIGENILLYGVPGCGKSYEIKTKYCNDDSCMERAVFHPDYTYSDFVGQILPKVSEAGNVTYEFEPGPFTRIIKKALDNPQEKYYLIVEEINRGNAPAIFGDIFQLLDRDESGESEYGISNEAIAKYVYNDKEKKVKIPSNLFILATMNTSDQNVFTLDTAFKRRWSMKHIENNIDACEFGNHPVCGSDITWRAFAKTINDLIIEVSTENLSNEDNRLGAYFVKQKELDDSRLFGEKVLMYLWNDAFKYDREKVFKSEYHTLDQLIDGFNDDGMDVFVNEVDFSVDTPNGMIAIEMSGKETPIENYLAGKSSHLLTYYNALRDLVKDRVPDARESSTKSLQYAAWRSDNISKSSFADIQIQNDRMLIFTEIPSNAETVIGEEIPKDGHHNHYYKIVYNENSVDDIVEIIVESYQQLKKG